MSAVPLNQAAAPAGTASNLPPSAADSGPHPPVCIEILVQGFVPCRYNRRGSADDPNSAVVGKGGFGTSYMYERDGSITPESSCETSAPGSARPSPSRSPHSLVDPMLELRSGRGFLPDFKPAVASQARRTTLFDVPGTSPRAGSGLISAGQRTRSFLAGSNSPYSPSTSRMHDGASRSASEMLPHRRGGRPPIPSVVVVKMCRTPCTGSFDELQKTSIIERKMRKAMMHDPELTHIRVVRGEGRILRYLQAAKEIGQQNGMAEEPNLVKLLADLPAHGKCKIPSYAEKGKRCPLASIEVEPDFSEGPPTRLLAFERLVEIDAELTSTGWATSKTPWSIQTVETMAIEVIQGLSFLHRHNVTHGDLKPSNLMKDPVTGCIKIIDLGASRRFVEVSNKLKDAPDAVDDGDIAELWQGRCRDKLRPELCEGLSSLTGSPHYMAPEILLQACRYADHRGRARSVLEDWEPHYNQYFTKQDCKHFEIAISDMRRGWGIRADLWSWSRTVSSLFLRTKAADERPSSATICPFDFSFSKHQDDFIEALHTPSAEEQAQPRFHLWSRHFPLYIIGRVMNGIELPETSLLASPELQSMMIACLQHQDQRPSAETIYEVLFKAHRERSLSMGPQLPPMSRTRSEGARFDMPSPLVATDSGRNLRHISSTEQFARGTGSSLMSSPASFFLKLPVKCRQEAMPRPIVDSNDDHSRFDGGFSGRDLTDCMSRPSSATTETQQTPLDSRASHAPAQFSSSEVWPLPPRRSASQIDGAARNSRTSPPPSNLSEWKAEDGSDSLLFSDLSRKLPNHDSEAFSAAGHATNGHRSTHGSMGQSEATMRHSVASPQASSPGLPQRPSRSSLRPASVATTWSPGRHSRGQSVSSGFDMVSCAPAPVDTGTEDMEILNDFFHQPPQMVPQHQALPPPPPPPLPMGAPSVPPPGLPSKARTRSISLLQTARPGAAVRRNTDSPSSVYSTMSASGSFATAHDAQSQLADARQPPNHARQSLRSHTLSHHDGGRAGPLLDCSSFADLRGGNTEGGGGVDPRCAYEASLQASSTRPNKGISRFLRWARRK